MTQKNTDARADLEQRIEAIESGYEFMLAYAAQGRDTDKGAGAGRNVREYLERMSTALADLGAVATACASSSTPARSPTVRAALPTPVARPSSRQSRAL